MRPLAQIRDNYEKIILTADRLTVGNYNGIRVKNLTDWLLGKENKSQQTPAVSAVGVISFKNRQCKLAVFSIYTRHQQQNGHF